MNRYYLDPHYPLKLDFDEFIRLETIGFKCCAHLYLIGTYHNTLRGPMNENECLGIQAMKHDGTLLRTINNIHLRNS